MAQGYENSPHSKKTKSKPPSERMDDYGSAHKEKYTPRGRNQERGSSRNRLKGWFEDYSKPPKPTKVDVNKKGVDEDSVKQVRKRLGKSLKSQGGTREGRAKTTEALETLKAEGAEMTQREKTMSAARALEADFKKLAGDTQVGSGKTVKEMKAEEAKAEKAKRMESRASAQPKQRRAGSSPMRGSGTPSQARSKASQDKPGYGERRSGTSQKQLEQERRGLQIRATGKDPIGDKKLTPEQVRVRNAKRRRDFRRREDNSGARRGQVRRANREATEKAELHKRMIESAESGAFLNPRMAPLAVAKIATGEAFKPTKAPKPTPARRVPREAVKRNAEAAEARSPSAPKSRARKAYERGETPLPPPRGKPASRGTGIKRLHGNIKGKSTKGKKK